MQRFSTPDLVGRILRTNMQRALSGEINPDDVMKAIDQLLYS